MVQIPSAAALWKSHRGGLLRDRSTFQLHTESVKM